MVWGSRKLTIVPSLNHSAIIRYQPPVLLSSVILMYHSYLVITWVASGLTYTLTTLNRRVLGTEPSIG